MYSLTSLNYEKFSYDYMTPQFGSMCNVDVGDMVEIMGFGGSLDQTHPCFWVRVSHGGRRDIELLVR